MADESEDLAQRGCPRCRVRLIAAFAKDLGALSRTTRDDAPPIPICGRCGFAEVFAAIPSTAWPVSAGQRALEDERWRKLCDTFPDAFPNEERGDA